MKKPTTLGEMVFHIHSEPSEVSLEIYEHLQTLQGARVRGSNTKHGLQELFQVYGDMLLIPVDANDAKLVGVGSTAYYIELTTEQQEFMGSTLNCATLENYNSSEPGEDKIICRKGKHGWELVLEIPCPIDIPAYRIYFIWSDTDNCLATWHPGPPMRFLPQDCAVKLR